MAEEIASVQMEEDVSFSRATTLMPHIGEPVAEATPLLYGSANPIQRKRKIWTRVLCQPSCADVNVAKYSFIGDCIS